MNKHAWPTLILFVLIPVLCWGAGSGEVGVFAINNDDSSQVDAASGLPVARYYGGGGVAMGLDYELLTGLSLHGSVEYSRGGSMVEYNNIKGNVSLGRMSRLGAQTYAFGGKAGLRLRPFAGNHFNFIAGLGVSISALGFNFNRDDYLAANNQNEIGYDESDSELARAYFEAGLEYVGDTYGARLLLQLEKLTTGSYEKLGNSSLKLNFERAMILLVQRF